MNEGRKEAMRLMSLVTLEAGGGSGGLRHVGNLGNQLQIWVRTGLKLGCVEKGHQHLARVVSALKLLAKLF